MGHKERTLLCIFGDKAFKTVPGLSEEVAAHPHLVPSVAFSKTYGGECDKRCYAEREGTWRVRTCFRSPFCCEHVCSESPVIDAHPARHAHAPTYP